MCQLTPNDCSENFISSQSNAILSRSPSGPPPPSPITPVSHTPASSNNTDRYPSSADLPRQHISTPSTFPKPVDFQNNSDVLAIKSALSILQMQKSTAERDIRTLQRIKSKALQHPEEFTRALLAGEIKQRPDPFFGSSNIHDHSNYEEESSRPTGNQSAQPMTWEKLPTPQKIIRSPAVNFAQYGVVSDSLDKVHEDQVARPSEGVPWQIEDDGSYTNMEEGDRPEGEMSDGTPHLPPRDRVLKESTK